MTPAGAAAINGSVLSLTVIICVTGIETLPQASVQVHVRVIVPPQLPPTNGPSVPVTVPAASQLSVYATSVIAGIAPHCTETGPGAAAITGATLSLIEIVYIHTAILPAQSVYVNV